MQIWVRWLLQNPADLDLHCLLLKKINWGSAGQELRINVGVRMFRVNASTSSYFPYCKTKFPTICLPNEILNKFSPKRPTLFRPCHEKTDTDRTARSQAGPAHFTG